MHQFRCSTSVLLIAFNRPEVTAKIFEAIRRAAPKRLYVAVDGPRGGYSEDPASVEEVRRIVSAVDWDCTVKTLFQEANLGCRRGVNTAIAWFFENEEMGIILEDDCLPDQTFFRFCEELLLLYKDEPRVMSISGGNYQQGRRETPDSYFFSIFQQIWGWATWRRAWRLNDTELSSWRGLRDTDFLGKYFKNRRDIEYWRAQIDRVVEEQLDTWDYGWLFSCWMQDGLCVIPSTNLVDNIGYGKDSTHTAGKFEYYLDSRPMEFPLKHPLKVKRSEKADRYVQAKMFNPFYWREVRWVLKKVMIRCFEIFKKRETGYEC